MKKLPTRWTKKHGAYYYITRESDRAFFDGKRWFRLGSNYPDALRTFAQRLDLQAGEELSSIIDRYTAEQLPTFATATQSAYTQSLTSLRAVLGHNKASVVTPQLVYQYMDHIAKTRTKNVANRDLMVLKMVLNHAVKWGLLHDNLIAKNVKAYGSRDGVTKSRARYVEDWELSAWASVASPLQRAFAAVVGLIGARKCEVLALQRSDIKDGHIRVFSTKTGQTSLWLITPALKEAINLALSIHKRPSLLIFPNRNGQTFINSRGLTPTFDASWRRSMQKAIEKTELKEAFTRHDLRAKTGSDAETLERAQQLLGHTSAEMTRKHYRRRQEVKIPTK